ncbi:putative rhodanese-related sulfurtransferase [Campylobacter pinnipediorum subsp. caledonicus]|uniref:Putative rhodanese-related sulfurtransferase n=1 Tax=Campylobacter pinnipediorum subsp. caledonicus TaxID=1874362 RepID=A0A1S6U9N3_9BACT|nr:rhodanese-like domain-containing protein [Campylobacter pinnipediorum]AQW86789.1 putative rhodanese-related sulfurtransferase [Campylobacter pinnipediorum subsp. caledonicus]AQW88444.1 putative rhodanese-related sulfurtransferase [Campylobacter pinnipediorum subsp. caledonicus]OPA72591.1 hypothetical protein BB381_05175 [Campylobacter pinnipediorum subsp. caledonicus]
MKKIYILAFCVLDLFSQVASIPATPANVEKFDQIIDMRVPIEIRETGIIKGAKIIEFSKDKRKLWSEISDEVDMTKPFAIICRSGRRSAFVADLIDTPDLNITIFEGGMRALSKQGYITTPYEK